MSELDNIDASADVITQEAAKQKEETTKLRDQQNGRVGEAIKEIEDNLLPALGETNSALVQAKAANDRATASANKTLDTLKKSPPANNFIRIEPDGDADDQAKTFLDAINQSFAENRPVSMPGNWDLSKFTPMILPGLLWLLGPFEIDFKNSHLGAMFSFSSGSGVRMRDGKLKGYDCFVSGTEKDYASYMTSEAFIWEEYGAQPALESGWITEFDVENCDFEWTPIRVLTGGKGSNPFQPERANPGIEKVRVKNCTSQVGFDIAAIRYGDCEFENVSLSVNMTTDRMNAFYGEFPNSKWPGNTGVGTTGSPIQSGYRFGIRIGRQNVPPEGGGSDLYYMDTNGKVEITKLRVPHFVTDVVPWPAKYDGKNNFNVVRVDATTNCVEDDIEINNAMDLALWRDTDYAAFVPLDCEPLYGKCKVTLTNAKFTNFGPCEGPFGFKPAYDGSTVSDIVVSRDMSKIPSWIQAMLANMPEAKDRFGTIYSAPNEAPNRQRALLSIADSSNNRIENITEEPFEMPPSGDDHLVAIYNGRKYPSNITIKDSNDQVIYRR